MPADAGIAPPRISGAVEPDGVEVVPKPRIVYGNSAASGAARREPSAAGAAGAGDITLKFTDTDIREVIRVILGDLLKLTYSIDPAVKGTATIQTAEPLSRESLLPLLESLLSQNGAALVRRGSVYSVVPTAAAAAGAPVGSPDAGDVTEVVPLRYVSAPDLAKVLEPYVAQGGKVTAGPAKNSLLVSGNSSVRTSLIALIRSFDVDFLADQSYAIFPLASAEPGKVANEVQRFVQAGGSGDVSGPVRVVALDRINAILVVSTAPGDLARVQQFIAQVDAVGETTERRLHVYYVQNGSAMEVGSVLQKAFSPQAGGTSPEDQGLPGSLAPNSVPAVVSTPIASQPLPGTPLPGGASPTMSQQPLSALPARATEPEVPIAAKGIRIIPDKRNNALLIFATPSEYSLIEATLHKIDVLPLQVLIEATIAEVTLNDALQYGTQFLFRKNDHNVTLSNASNGSTAAAFPGFAYAFSSATAQITLSALQNLTKVRVISDPQLLVLDNDSARLQVGDIVPITTQTAVSVLTTGAPVVNSVEYRETGVILQVTPRVNSGGLVTLDIEQEVSQVVPTTTSSINSPTIQQRKIKSRVVVQDGETIGLGGLIKDNSNISNQGLPWLTDVPVLGALFGTRSNAASRTELLILLTPRVIRDQRSARALTEDLRARFGRLNATPDRRDPIEPPGPLRQ